jgi:hypothetical protein
MKLEFSRQIFLKQARMSNVKIRPVGAELFHTDGQTDLNPMVAFRNFSNALKKRLFTSVLFNVCCLYLQIYNWDEDCVWMTVLIQQLQNASTSWNWGYVERVSDTQSA